jgi:hypothetical protein
MALLVCLFDILLNVYGAEKHVKNKFDSPCGMPYLFFMHKAVAVSIIISTSILRGAVA